MDTSLTVRRYRAEDGDRVRELYEEAMRETGAFVDGAPDGDLRDVGGEYLDAGGEFLVGEAAGVRTTDLRRTGAARERGIREFVLDATPKQEAAGRLYEQNGFSEATRGRVRACGEEFTLILYRKSLERST